MGQVGDALMTVFIFEVDKQFRDAGKLTDELIRRGAVPKCREPEELKEPSWRETTNFVHIRIEGSWHNIKYIKKLKITKEPVEPKLIDFKVDEFGKPEPIMHIHRYFNEEGTLLLSEETKMKAIIVNKTEDLLPPETMPHTSFGNGVTVTEIYPRIYIAFAVFDHKKRKLADEVIEQIRL